MSNMLKIKEQTEKKTNSVKNAIVLNGLRFSVIYSPNPTIK